MFFVQNFGVKPNVTREKLLKDFCTKKRAHKMLVKLTPGECFFFDIFPTSFLIGKQKSTEMFLNTAKKAIRTIIVEDNLEKVVIDKVIMN